MNPQRELEIKDGALFELMERCHELPKWANTIIGGAYGCAEIQRDIAGGVNPYFEWLKEHDVFEQNKKLTAERDRLRKVVEAGDVLAQAARDRGGLAEAVCTYYQAKGVD
jgi:hypothetical protein